MSKVWQMNHFSTVCRSKPSHRSKSTHPRKPSKDKHRARPVDIEDPSCGETSTLTGADDDDSEEYTFNIGAQGPQTTKLPIRQTCLSGQDYRHTRQHNGRFWR